MGIKTEDLFSEDDSLPSKDVIDKKKSITTEDAFSDTDEEKPENQNDGFLQGVSHGVQDIISPIGENIKDLVSNVQKEAETGGERFGQANDPLSKSTAIGGTVARIGGQVLGAPIKLGTDELKNFLENIPGYNRLTSSLDQKANIAPSLSKAQDLLSKVKAATYDKLPNAGKDIVDIGVNTLGAPILKAEAKPLLSLGNKAIESTGEKLGNIANRIQGTKVKINMPEMKKGAMNDLYGKYEVFGNAKQANQQWNEKLSDVANQLKQKLEVSASDPANYADVNEIFNDAKTTLLNGKSKTAQIELNNALDNLQSQFNDAYQNGKINILDAQIEKQHIGKKGDWLNKNGATSGNPQASLDAQAHNALYDALKKNIENKGTEGIKELNKQLSEMIPMERASAKQVLIENRKNPISLDDYLGGLAVASSASAGHFLPAIMAGANMITKSPNIAKLSHNVGKGLNWAATKDLSKYLRKNH